MSGFGSTEMFGMLALFVKTQATIDFCIFHGKRKLHSVYKAFTHL